MDAEAMRNGGESRRFSIPKEKKDVADCGIFYFGAAAPSANLRFQS